MARGKKKESALTPEEKLAQALVPEGEQPYKVPENWCWTTVGTVAAVVTGGTPSKNHPEYYDGTFPFYKPSDLDAGRYVYEASEYLSDEGKSVSRIIPQNSTAVCCIGSIGKCGFITREGTTNQQINSAIPYFNPLYLYYFLNTDQFINELWSKASATTISIVNKSKMEQCYFPLAPIAEQQRIVARIEYLFAKLDEAKEKAQSVLDSFETRKAAILHKAFIGELTAKWRAAHGIETLVWEQRNITEVCVLRSGTTIPADEELEKGAIPYIKVADMNLPDNSVQILTSSRFVDSCPESHSIPYGSTIFPKRGGAILTNKKRIVGVPQIIADLNTMAIIPDQSKLLGWYGYYWMLSVDLRELNNGSNVPQINNKDMVKLFIPVPTIAEQNEIVRILDSLFAKEQQAKEAAEAVLEKIDLLKKTILARAFRGELGTNDPTEESALELLKEILKGDI